MLQSTCACAHVQRVCGALDTSLRPYNAAWFARVQAEAGAPEAHQVQGDQLWQRPRSGADLRQEAAADFWPPVECQMPQARQRRQVRM